IVACTSCHRRLCNECFRFRLGESPACVACAYEVSTRPQRRVSLAVSFLCFSYGFGFWATRHWNLWNESADLVLFFAVPAAIIAIVLAWSARDPRRPSVENRDLDEDEPPSTSFQPRGTPYRASARRLIAAASPRLSGRATALVVSASLIAAAVLLPASLKL